MTSNDDEWNSVVLDSYYDGHDLRLSLTIKKFLSLVCKPGKKLETRQVECTNCCRTKWVLSVYPYGRSEEEKDSVAIFLKLKTEPSHAKLVKAMFEINVVIGNGCETRIVHPCNSEEIKLRFGYGFLKMINRSEIETDQRGYLWNEDLIIRCDGSSAVSLNHSTVPSKAKSKVGKISYTSNRHSELMKKMYQESIGCDIVVKSGSSEFKCHKNVLAASSAYFKAMFQHDMKENRENEVDLSKDLNEEELGALIDYIYLDNSGFEKLSRASLQNLYKKGNMLEIKGLREACEMGLIMQLDEGNARELMVFAITYCAKRLEKAAATIIANGF